jgi:hypothetical protein
MSTSVSWEPRRYGPDELCRIPSIRSRDSKTAVTALSYASCFLVVL